MTDNETFWNMRGMINTLARVGRYSGAGQWTFLALVGRPTYKPGVAGSNPAVPTFCSTAKTAPDLRRCRRALFA
jgi:hypothetical protein